MGGVLVYVWLGLGAGALYALVSQGLIVLQKGSGVVNLALGAVALASAFTFSAIQPDLGTAGAAVAAIALSAAVGLAAYVLVMRPLRGAPPLAMLVGSLGVLLVVEAGVLLIFNNMQITTPVLFQGAPYVIFGAAMQPVRLYLIILAVVLAGVLAVAFSKTRFGIYTRAAAETEKGLTLIGRSPARIAAVNWVLGSAIAGVAGVAATQIAGLQVDNLVLLVVPGLAAALVARFSSFTAATLAALALGVLQSLVGGYWVQPALTDLVPFGILVIVLMVTGRPIPDRGTLASSVRTPEVTPAKPTISAGVAVCLAVLGLVFLGQQYQSALIISIITAIIAVSLVIVTGYVGQVSLAQFVLAGVGGFATSRFAANLGWPFPAPLLAAMVISAAVGLVVGIPSLRVRGFNLAVLTLAAAVTVQSALFNNINITGAGGGDPVPAPSLGGFSLSPFGHPVRFGVMVLIVLALCMAATAWLRNSQLGLRMLAVRDNERAASAVGWNVSRTKLLAFTISAALAGVGGSLLVYQSGVVVANQFTPLASILFVGYVYVAGIGSLSGAVLAGLAAPGGLIVTWLQFLLPVGNIQYWVNLVLAAFVLVAVVKQPDGIMPFHGRQLAAVQARLLRRFGRDRTEPDSALAELDPAPAAAVASTDGPPGQNGHREVAAGAPILHVADLTVRFGAVTALDGVALNVAVGRVTGLIGPNGSGKSTFVDAVSGFARNTGGIALRSVSFDRKTPHSRARAGLARTFQGLELFEQLSVYENVLSGVAAAAGRGRRTRSAARQRVEGELRRLGLHLVSGRMPAAISPGQRRLVAVARAVVSQPALLILDEPASGLDRRERDVLRGRLHELADSGASVLLIEHDVDLVFDVCDDVYVLDNGRLIASGPAVEVRRDPAVIAAYLGEAEDDDVQGLEAAT
jgi:ABC-type branched-subunit amino acid transport system ATPase component/branched-subunit amino acid ABC-type transport system permease component